MLQRRAHMDEIFDMMKQADSRHKALIKTMRYKNYEQKLQEKIEKRLFEVQFMEKFKFMANKKNIKTENPEVDNQVKYRRAKPKVVDKWEVDPLKPVEEKDYVHSNKRKYPCRRKSFKRKSYIDDYWNEPAVLNQNSTYSYGQSSPSRSPIHFNSSEIGRNQSCLLYTSPSPRDLSTSRMPSSA